MIVRLEGSRESKKTVLEDVESRLLVAIRSSDEQAEEAPERLTVEASLSGGSGTFRD